MAELTVPMLKVLDYSWYKGINNLENQRIIPMVYRVSPDLPYLFYKKK